MEYLVCLYVLVVVASFSSCSKIGGYEQSNHNEFGKGEEKYGKMHEDSQQSQLRNNQDAEDVALISSYGGRGGSRPKEFGRDYEGRLGNTDDGGRHKIMFRDGYGGGEYRGDSYRDDLGYNYGEVDGRHVEILESNFKDIIGKNRGGGKFGNGRGTIFGISNVERGLEGVLSEVERDKKFEDSYRRGKQYNEDFDRGREGQYEGLDGSYGTEHGRSEVLEGVYRENKGVEQSYGGEESYRGGRGAGLKGGYEGGKGLRTEYYGGTGLGSGYGSDKGFDIVYGLDEGLGNGYGEGKVSKESYELVKIIGGDYEESKGSGGGKRFGGNKESEGSYAGGKGLGNIYGAGEGLDGSYGKGKGLEKNSGYKGKIGSKEFEDLYDVIKGNRQGSHRVRGRDESGGGKGKAFIIPVIKHVPVIQHVPVIDHIKVFSKTDKGGGDVRRKKYASSDLSFNGHSQDSGRRRYNKISNNDSNGGFGNNYGGSGWMMDTVRNGYGGRSSSRGNLSSEGSGRPEKLPINGGMFQNGGKFGHLFGRHVNEVW